MDQDKTNTVDNEVLSTLHYSSLEDAGREMVYLQAESKVSEYRAEVERFRKKYGASFDKLKRTIEEQTGEEDFELEDDLLAWRFARDSLEYWQTKLKELK
ncbi:MAG: hypothetical protein KGZ25_11945 [Planctomycetes bacterium]|nr:hypothetical protein [Planctomycetota bacterium]